MFQNPKPHGPSNHHPPYDPATGKMTGMHFYNLPLTIRTALSQPLVALLCGLCLLPAAALAACNDAPAAGVDWGGCEKNRLILRKAQLQGAKLAGTTLNGGDLAQANLSGADLTRASVERVRFSGAELERAKLVRLIAYRANFSAAKLVGADLTKAELMRSNFTSANLSNANLEKAELQRAVLSGANLTGANLTGADLDRAVLTKSNLAGAKFAQARMFLTRLEGVDLTGVSGLVQSQLDGTCGDSQTKLPKGLKPSSSWPCPKEE